MSTGEALAQKQQVCVQLGSLFLQLRSMPNGALFPDCAGKGTFAKVHFTALTFHLKVGAKLETDPVMQCKDQCSPQVWRQGKKGTGSEVELWEKERSCWARWYMPAVLALEKLRQESCCELGGNLDHTAWTTELRSCLKN